VGRSARRRRPCRRRQDFVTRGVSEVWVCRGSRVRSPPVPVVLSVYQRGSLLDGLQCICRVIRRSSMTMKANTYYIIFGRPPIGGKLPPFLPLAAPLLKRHGLIQFIKTRRSKIGCERVLRSRSKRIAFASPLSLSPSLPHFNLVTAFVRITRVIGLFRRD